MFEHTTALFGLGDGKLFPVLEPSENKHTPNLIFADR